MSAKVKTHNRSPQNITRLRKIESLERLKDRVEAAAQEIIRLREENGRLASDISGLRNTVAEHRRRPSVVFDEDPKALRAKVKGFIEAIDQYLQTET